MAGKTRGLRTEIPSHYRSPGALLEELGIDEPEDIQVEAIAQHCGATIVYEPLHGSEARLIGYGKRAFITVNSASGATRRRFSAAHELGHWMWDRGKTAYVCGEDSLQTPLVRGEENPERRANRYAVELLLPEGMFHRFRVEVEPTLRGIQRLARLFQTSLTATALRWVELSPTPQVLASYGREGRQWWAKGPGVPYEVELKPRPDPLTAVYQFLEGGRRIVESVPLQAPFWFQDATLPHSIREDSVPLGNGTVLTLLTLE